MYKLFVTLFRGRANEAVEQVAAAHALTILDQQMRESGALIAQAKRGLAVAMAEDGQEAARAAALAERVAGLEARAVAALAGGREDLALEAATAMAALEREQQQVTQARAVFATDIGRLKETVRAAEQRFAAVGRGRRLARVGEAVRRSQNFAGALGVAEAEATLEALRMRQGLEAAADEALHEMDAPEAIEIRLDEAGFGPERPDGAKILARLKLLANAQG